MSILLVHELHEARDRILVLKQELLAAKKQELPAYIPLLDEQIGILDEALETAKIPERYRVAVVGRFKVGKSSFVNKLAGERLAGVHTNPETAAISVFRYADEARAEVELVSTEEWERLRLDHAEDPKYPEVKRYDSFTTFNKRPLKKDKAGREIKRDPIDLEKLSAKWLEPAGKLHRIVARSWKSKEGKKEFLRDIKAFTSSQEPLHYLVNKLTIYAPIPILRDQIELVDTPGLDDTEKFRVVLTEELVKDVDAILFLTVSGASYSQSDKDFIVRQLRKRQIKHLQMIVTKSDETFENAVRDARENDEDPLTYQEFKVQETSRVKYETSQTLNDLLNANQLTDEDGYYFIDQLDHLPIHLISTKYHEDGEEEKAGIDAVRDGLYRILSTSNRFEHARTILHDRLEIVSARLRKTFSERLNTLESEFDPAKVREEIEEIRRLLKGKLDEFGNRSGETLGLLGNDQEAFMKSLPLHLDLLTFQAREVLNGLEKLDLIKHWKTRRYGGWGEIIDLQSQIADKVFPKVESLLNELRGQLETFMKGAGGHLEWLQKEISAMEAELQISSLEPMALSATQRPLFSTLKDRFERKSEAFRDSIVSNLDDFVTSEVQERLQNTKANVTEVVGTGTTVRQTEEIATFYGEIRRLLAEALRNHLEARVTDFIGELRKTAESVVPRIREATEGVMEQRLAAVESALEVASEGQKGRVSSYLAMMLEKTMESRTRKSRERPVEQSGKEKAEPAHPQDSSANGNTPSPNLNERHFEIEDGATGYTYDRIFCPYLNEARKIRIEDPYLRFPHQIDNLTRFCALAARLGWAESIDVLTGLQPGEDPDDADSRLETLRRDLEDRGIRLTWKRKSALHDREIRLDNGWIIKIGRGLDIYHKPEQWLSIEAADFSMRRCRQTKVDIFKEAETDTPAEDDASNMAGAAT